MPKRSAAAAVSAVPDDLFAQPVNDDLPADAGRGRRRAPPPRDGTPDEAGYTAASIEVLEGLEPVRRRPGMYIGGTDDAGLHHLFAEVIDNAMDEAVAGHASRIDVALEADGFVSVTDNGRGIPVDPHPKFPDRSALEVIMTTLHAGGKFDSGAYQTSGGLHGVGISVVNALSERLDVEVARGQTLYRQSFARGLVQGPLETVGRVANRRGTKVRFKPDAEIFGAEAKLEPARLFRMARSKAYLFGGVEVRWHCDASLVAGTKTPEEATFRFPGGLKDHLAQEVEGRSFVTDAPFTGKITKPGGHGSLEWAVAWLSGRGRVRPFLLQHDPDAERRHPRGRPAQCAVAGLERPCRADRPKPACRRRDGRRYHAEAVPPCSPCSSASRSSRGRTRAVCRPRKRARIVDGAVRDAFDHWLAGRSLAGLEACSTGASSGRTSDSGASPRRTWRASPPPASCACRASWPTAPTPLRRDRNCSSWRATVRAGRPSRREIVPARPILPLRGKILNVANATRDKLAQQPTAGRPRARPRLWHRARTTGTPTCVTTRSSS